MGRGEVVVGVTGLDDEVLLYMLCDLVVLLKSTELRLDLLA